MHFVILAALVGLMGAVHTFRAEGAAPIGAGPAVSVGFLLLAAYFSGAIFKSMRLPKLTGYLGAGILAGHSGLNLLPPDALDDLQIVTGVAVALIALTAGTELELRSMRPLFRTIRWVTLVAVVGGAFALVIAVFALQGLLPFMAGTSLRESAAIALVLGVVMAAQSPAVVVALRTELAADGPISRTVLGVVVVADLVVIVLFAASSAVANAMLGGADGGLTGTLLHLVWELGGSIVVGLGIGFLLGLYLGRVRDGAPLFVLMVAFVVAEVGQRVGLDPLLVALAAGVLLRNATPLGDATHHAIEGSSLPVYLVFFAVAGATIHLDVLAVVGIPAVILVLVRAGAFLFGSRYACKLAGAPEPVRRWVGVGLLPQAGLALALAMMVAKTFPTFGPEAAALVLGIVALNEIIAPVLYRFALVRSGEAGAAITPPDPSGETSPSPAPDAPGPLPGAPDTPPAPDATLPPAIATLPPAIAADAAAMAIQQGAPLPPGTPDHGGGPQ
jgi:Kef-type K+ transport system membrane component KefB